MSSRVCEDKIDGDRDLGLCRWLERPVYVILSFIWAEAILLVRLQVFIQKYEKKASLSIA